MKFTAFLLTILFSALWAHGHSIQTVKGTKALLQLDDGPAALDDVFLVLDSAGFEKAQIQIRQIKDKRAIAQTIKGELSQAPETYMTYSLELVPKAVSAKPAVPAQKVEPVITPPIKPAMNAPPPSVVNVPQATGYYGGLSQNQMSVSLTNATNLKLTGMSFNFGAFYERALTHRVQVLGRAGYEGLKATGSLSSNACGASCDVDISYLAADAIAKYSFYDGKKTWWLGGGLGFLFPLLKSSNVIDSSKLTLGEKIIFASGVNWYQTTTTFIPVQFEYALQPSNNVVTTNQFVLRVGYGTSF